MKSNTSCVFSFDHVVSEFAHEWAKKDHFSWNFFLMSAFNFQSGICISLCFSQNNRLHWSSVRTGKRRGVLPLSSVRNKCTNSAHKKLGILSEQYSNCVHENFEFRPPSNTDSLLATLLPPPYRLWNLEKFRASSKTLGLEKILSFRLGSGTWKNSDLFPSI